MAKTKEYRSVSYLGGIPSFPKRKTCRVAIGAAGLSIHTWGSTRATIRLEEIEDLQVIPFLSLFGPRTQDKSVVGRALVGGLLLGPLGAVVGGMSGIGTKQKLTGLQARHKNDYVLLVRAIENGIRYQCGFVFRASWFKEASARKPFEQLQSLRAHRAQQLAERSIGARSLPGVNAEL